MKQEEPTFPEKLFACWHPIRYGYEITDNPYGTFLLDQAVVVWRSSEDFPVFANEDIVQPERRSVYELLCPTLFYFVLVGVVKRAWFISLSRNPFRKTNATGIA